MLDAKDEAPDVHLSTEETRRYRRHLTLPEVGTAGQKRLKQAKVLLVGAGGLGSPLAIYLAAAGVGTLGMVDSDTVELSNLQRQVIHPSDSVGADKLESAAATIARINPHVEFVAHPARLTADNALELIGPYDVVADGTDNFAARYLVNDACVMLGKPDVYGSIFRFEGQASVFALGDGPCYRCLFPEPPPGPVPDCAEGGVLGVLPGIIGLIQATEVIKVILGRGETLAGRLLLFDALAMKFRELRLARAPDCPVCSDKPTITELVEIEQVCQPPPAPDALPAMTAQELKARMDRGEDDLVLLDVREKHEYRLSRLPGAVLAPLAELPDGLGELDREAEVVVYCRSGRRSAAAAAILLDNGFAKVTNLTGGILAWADQIDPDMQT